MIRALLACLLLWAVALPSQAADPASPEGASGKKASKSASGERKSKTAPMKVTAPGGSGESAAERSARLRRECKGRPNAGACTGYTD